MLASSLVAQALELADLMALSKPALAAGVEMEKPAWERVLAAIGPSPAPYLDKLVAALGMTAERLLVRLMPAGPPAPAAVRRFETPPGEQAPADWGHVGDVEIDG